MLWHLRSLIIKITCALVKWQSLMNKRHSHSSAITQIKLPSEIKWKITITFSIKSHSVISNLQITGSQTGEQISNPVGKRHFSRSARNQTLIRNKTQRRNGICDARRSQLSCVGTRIIYYYYLNKTCQRGALWTSVVASKCNSIYSENWVKHHWAAQ